MNKSAKPVTSNRPNLAERKKGAVFIDGPPTAPSSDSFYILASHSTLFSIKLYLAIFFQDLPFSDILSVTFVSEDGMNSVGL